MSGFSAARPFPQLTSELSNFLTGAYPSFITGAKGIPDKIPVFSFHDVSYEGLSARLTYLSKNGYQTVTMDEWLERNGDSRGERLVLLTFDDGHASLWRVAYPLLKSLNMKATAFLLPGEIQEANSVRSYDGAPSGDPLVTWPEVLAMGDIIEIGSHSLYHQTIFTGKEPAGYYTPALRESVYLIDRPMIPYRGEETTARDYPIGTPLYKSDARLGVSPRIFPSDEIIDACSEYVARNGAENFFIRRPDWGKLLDVVREKAESKSSFIIETKEERLVAIEKTIAESKNILEGKTGQKVDHFCFPFAVGSHETVTKVKEAGYKTALWGVKRPEYTSGNDSLTHVTRIKDDFIFRLPGEERWSLIKIIGDKAKRRLGSESLLQPPTMAPQIRVPKERAL